MEKASLDLHDREEVRRRILHRIADLGGKQRAFAAHVGVSQAFVSAVLYGRKQPSEKILNDVGLKQVVLYQDINSADQND